MKVDLILRRGTILTLASDEPGAAGSPVDALAVKNGRVIALGDDIDGLHANTDIDLAGATVAPGFGDAHNHMAWFGLGLGAIDLTEVADMASLYRAVAEHATNNGADGLISGSGYDDNLLGGHPTAEEIDAVAHGRPVWLTHRSGHMCVVNTPLLEQVGLLDGSVDVPQGGIVERRDGRPTGLLQEQAQNLVIAAVTPYSVETLSSAIGQAARRCAAEGLTHVTECGIGAGWLGKSPQELAAYVACRDAGQLPVRVQLMPSVDSLHDLGHHRDDHSDFGLDLGVRTGFGDDMIRIGAMKIWLDGSLLGRTAAVHEAYECAHGATRHDRGHLQDSPDRMRQQIMRAHASGWSVAAHAIGDRAIDFALDVFSEALAASPRPDARHRIEHAGITSPEQVARIAELGVTPVPQIRFIHDIGDSMLSSVGERRSGWLYRHRSLLAAGCRVPGSSDRPVADGAPLHAMASMVERRTSSGRVLGATERVDPLTALRAYTVDAAWVAGDEASRGMLAPGYLADLVVLDRDITSATPEDIHDTRVLTTVLGGVATFDTGLGLPGG